MAEISQEELQTLKTCVNPHGDLIFAMVCGSASYNLNLATSDRDLFGVFLATETGPFNKPTKSFNHHDPDYVIYEIDKFAEFLLKGNPSMIQPLFAEKLCWSLPEWTSIHAVRNVAINKVSAEQYIKFAKQQLKTSTTNKGEKDTKKLYHAMRLLKEVQLILNGQPPQVYWTGEGRDYIMNIRTGNADYDAVVKEIDQMLEDATAFLKTSTIPASINLKELASWLVPLKIQQLKVAPHPSYPLELFQQSGELLNDELRVAAYEILKENKIEGTILFCAPYGANGISDSFTTQEKDYLAVYCGSISSTYNTLEPLPNVISKSKAKHKKGWQLVEIRYFLQSVSSGNHVYTESLFQDPKKCWKLPVWDSLLTKNGTEKNPLYLLQPAHIMHYLGSLDGLILAKHPTEEEKIHSLRIGAKMLFQGQKMVNGVIPNQEFTENELGILGGSIPPYGPEELSAKRKELQSLVEPRVKELKKHNVEFLNVFIIGVLKALLSLETK